MKITMSATLPQLDKKKYIKLVKTEIERAFRKAGKEFLRAAIYRIPVWTGMARGAFKNVERAVGRIEGFGLPSKIRKNYYYNGRQRTAQYGQELATKPEDILAITGAVLATGRSSYYFRFATNIKYFNYLDDKKWGAMKAGGDAMRASLVAELKLPSPLKAMVRKTYTVN